MTYKIIRSFNNIKIYDNSIIFCDIDDTILKYKNKDLEFWDKLYNYYLDKTKNEKKVVEQLNNKWCNLIKKNIPLYTDKDGFFKMLNRVNKTNSILIFITARIPNSNTIIYKHFIDLKIDYLKYPIFFIGHKSKADFIKKKNLIS
jgi:hypothetical protein